VAAHVERGAVQRKSNLVTRKEIMSHPTRDETPPSLLDAIRQIEPEIRAHAADAERDRRLSDAVADAMRNVGLYRMWRPKALGGLEMDPMSAFRVLEEVARIDSAAGWNLQLSTAVDALGAWFPDDGAAEIFGSPDARFAGGFFPFRRAVVVEGGYRVSGQTPFASGAHQATWFDGLAHVYDGETPRLNEAGMPVTIITMCPAADVAILDTWHTMGMRGTGSHDVVMTDVFVPERRTALLAPYDKPGDAYRGPLYKFTVWTAICVIATVPLGVARAALDELLELASRKTPSYLTTALRERITVHGMVGEADAMLGAARAYLYESLREVWDKALDGHLIDMPGKMKMQQAATHALAASAKVVDLVQTIAGTSGVREAHQIQRHFRDIHTLRHHAYVSASRYESAGQYLLGVPIEWPFYGL
jgi:alkylation response protein AidB-like acyl-CoA dehydrogenase